MGKIGVFDSGYGGLSILKKIRQTIPQYDYIYLGDNARAPYGVQTEEVIYRYSLEAVEYLFNKGCTLIIFACNTASAVALRKLQQEYLPTHYPNRRILGVLIPAVEEVAEKGYKKVGIMATPATVASSAFTAEIHKLSPKTEVIEKACPALVPMIEEHITSGQDLQSVIGDYVSPLIKANADAVILGCTHYELVSEEIKKALPEGVALISEGAVVASRLLQYIEKHHQLLSLSSEGTLQVVTTGKIAVFNEGAELFYGEEKLAIKSISEELRLI